MLNKKVDISTGDKGKIIGRWRELELLKELFESKKSEFIAIYGRRRVGKTYLIKNLIDSLPAVFFHVTGIQKGGLKDQLAEFAKQIGSTFYQDRLLFLDLAGLMLLKISLPRSIKSQKIKK